MSEPFLSRWSRLKRQTAQTSAPVEADALRSMPAAVAAAPSVGPAADLQAPALSTAPADAVRPDTAFDAQRDPQLPDLGTLTGDSDFVPFMQRQVNETVRRQALRTLFADPRFNVMDGLDVYIDDYSVSDPIPPEMLASLEQTKRLFGLTASGEDAADATTLANAAGTLPPAVPATNSPPVAVRDAGARRDAPMPGIAEVPSQATSSVANCDNLSSDGQIVAAKCGKSV